MKKRLLYGSLIFLFIFVAGVLVYFKINISQNIKSKYSYVDHVIDEINEEDIEYIKTDLTMYEYGKLYKENYMETDENGKLAYKTKYKVYMKK